MTPIITSQSLGLWLEFALAAAIIVFAGIRLSRYGDVIAEKTGLGRTWIGVLLMAAVTSLPELITGASSVILFDVPNIAVGDVLGSCMFNLLILAMLDVHTGYSIPLSTRAHRGHVVTAAFGVLLLGIASLSLAAPSAVPQIGWFGASSVLFIVIYFVAMRTIYLDERRRIIHEVAEQAQYGEISKSRAFTLYALNAALVIAAATYLPSIGERIAESTGLGRTFVGTFFIAIATSLPEIVVSVAAVKMGAIDLAVGNLLGSNVFNIWILGLDDLLYRKGPLLSHVTPTHLISAISAIVMTSIALIGLSYRAEQKRLFLAWDSLGIAVVYAIGTYVLYSLR